MKRLRKRRSDSPQSDVEEKHTVAPVASIMTPRPGVQSALSDLSNEILVGLMFDLRLHLLGLLPAV
jgi:hypothetical protein